jgi:leucyl-tRNA synthetase
MTDYDPQAIESKWRDRWREEGAFEADPGDDPDEDSTFITVPYPYPSGGMHIGHARTYTVPDVYARYRRLRGDNVLFPIAWHVTGTPIVGAVERLKKGEEEQLSVLRDTYDVDEETLADLETPMGYAEHFIENHYKAGMKQLGLSIDWRREFTTNDERYSKFISWQYETLKDRGLLEKGLHPVNYCTNEQQPVTHHDILEGEDAEFQEFTLVTFESDEAVFPMATLRPETVRGVTNAFVHPDAEYAYADVDGETWLVSSQAVEKLRLQARDVEEVERVPGDELVGERVSNPITDEEIVLLPATFVDPDNATGVVMSVPAHSPDDYVALQEVTERADELTDYGIDPDAVRAIEPVPILTIEGYGEIPARDSVERYDVASQNDPALEEATQDLYNAEFHEGRLVDAYGEYAGEVVEDVRDEFRADYQERGAFDSMHEFTEEVVCRCGGEVEVAEQDTWFLRYIDEGWQAKTERAIERLDAIPENTREQYSHTVDWLEEWPCIRNYGLGTRLPWDRDFVIEPLSDSTIYMAYYTIAHRLEDVPVEEMDHAFFDTLFYGPDAVEEREARSASDRSSGAEQSSADSRAAESFETAEPSRDDGSREAASEPPRDDGDEPREPNETALDLREEWDYWYPVDYRISGNDLIQNHLTFFLYHHAELFDEANWPEGITIMGMGLLEGEKMSSSSGHVVLPGEAIDRYGADTVRFFLLNSAEPWQDYDWRDDLVDSTHNQLRRFYNRAVEVIEDAEGEARSASDGSSGERSEPRDGERDLNQVDRWLLSKLQSTVRAATEALEGFETRTASQVAFYDFEEALRWYRRRAELSRPGARWTLREVLRTRLRLLAPFVPHVANELHERLTGDPVDAWPEPDPDLESARVEAEETLVESLVDDVHDIVDVTGTDPDTVRVYVAPEWKRRVFETVVETGTDVGAVMSEVMQDEDLRERGDAVNDLVQELVDVVRDRDEAELDALREVDERRVYEDASRFLVDEFDAAIQVYTADQDPVDPAGKADDAVPLRPAVHIE